MTTLPLHLKQMKVWHLPEAPDHRSCSSMLAGSRLLDSCRELVERCTANHERPRKAMNRGLIARHKWLAGNLAQECSNIVIRMDK